MLTLKIDAERIVQDEIAIIETHRAKYAEGHWAHRGLTGTLDTLETVLDNIRNANTAKVSGGWTTQELIDDLKGDILRRIGSLESLGNETTSEADTQRYFHKAAGLRIAWDLLNDHPANGEAP